MYFMYGWKNFAKKHFLTTTADDGTPDKSWTVADPEISGGGDEVGVVWGSGG